MPVPNPTATPTRSAPSLTDASGKAVVWVLLFLLVAGAAVAVWYFAFRTQGSQSAALAQRVIPSDSDVVGGIDLGRLLTSPELRKLASDNGADLGVLDRALAQANIATSDIGALAFGATMDGATPRDIVIALEAKTDAQAMIGFLRLVASQLPPPLNGLIDVDGIQAVDGTTAGNGIFVMGSGEILKKALALGRGGAAGAGQEELALVQKALDTGAGFWFAAPVPADTFKGLSGAMTTKMIGGTPSHFGLSIGVGKTIALKAAMYIPGADAATISGALKTARKMFAGQLPDAQKTLLNDIDIGGNGPVVSASINLSESMLATLMKQVR